MKAFLLCCFVLAFTSCKMLLVNAYLKDPVVETKASIANFLTSNHYSTDNVLILKGDTSSAIINLFMGMTEDHRIFDKEGNPICYKGSETCSGVTFKQFLQNKTDSFERCDTSKSTLASVLRKCYTLNGDSVSINSFPPSDYYLVIFWQKFMGGKRGYEDDVAWMEEEVAATTTGKKYTVIKINTDLQDTWGLTPGAKAKLKVKKTGRSSLNMTVENLPVKR